MLNTFVVIDIETTGLDPRRAQMIEVAALLVRDGQIIDRMVSLINPDVPIPFEVTQITGITNEMVHGAPAMLTVRRQLTRLIGDHIVVGHNVDFDLGFLRQENVAYGNHRLDTLTLASILLPRAGRHSLEHLVKLLGLPETGRHRAEADAINTAQLFGKLGELAREQPTSLLAEIVEAGQVLGWPETIFFQEALAARVRTAFTAAERPTIDRRTRLFDPPSPEGRALTPPLADEPEKLQAIDIKLISDLLKPGSNFSRVFDGFEPRKQQVQMLQAVARAFNTQQHLLVEAGTGTGKSLAYLLPAAFWAHANERRVVISTNTINLQDQLIHKDIPALQQALPFQIQVAVRKGKGNYLCARLFQQMRHRGPRDAAEMTLFARLVLWLGQTQTGDVSEITLRTPDERSAWRRLSGENAPCTRQECSSEKCPLHFARRRAELAHIVIVNHALLLSDVANQNHILPEFRELVIDEAHHLETAVTDGLSFSVDKRTLDGVLGELIDPKSGVVGDLVRQLNAEATEKQRDAVERILAPLRDQAKVAEVRLAEFFDTLLYFVNDYLVGRSDFAQQVRLVPAIRADARFENVRLAWDNLKLPLGQIAKGMGRLAEVTGELKADGVLSDGDELQATLAAYANDLEKTRLQIDQIVANPSDEMIIWIEQWKERLSLHAAPLHVGPLIEEHIFHKLDTVVMTSATLRTAPQGRADEANFDYICSRLNAHEVNTLAVGSPFDYKRNTLLYLCSDMPEPNQPGYQRMVEQAILDTARTLGGRTLVLFTSNKQLRETAQALQAPLADADILLLAQLEGSSRQQLTEQFRRPGTRAVLLGTRSFWEGVDVPGPALSAVVIVKLPFDVPSDPVVGARSETFTNAFMEYTIPEAVLRFRQGFGRLIRRKDDEGAVIVLDKRLLSRRYGDLFLNALPECVVLRQRAGRIAEVLQRWERRDRS